MNKTILIQVFWFCSLFIACSQNVEVDNSNIIEKIALDEDYHKLSQLIRSSGELVALGKYDIELVHEVSEQFEGQSFCDIPQENYDGIRGAEQYFKLHCEIDKATDKVKEKYPFYINISRDDFDKLRALYRKNHPQTLEKDKIDKIKKRYEKID